MSGYRSNRSGSYRRVRSNFKRDRESIETIDEISNDDVQSYRSNREINHSEENKDEGERNSDEGESNYDNELVPHDILDQIPEERLFTRTRFEKDLDQQMRRSDSNAILDDGEDE
jgi:hypothetical protein